MLTALAVILVGAWMAIESQTAVSATATLIWGILVVVLVVVEIAQPLYRRRAP
jgi:hypothetical protein